MNPVTPWMHDRPIRNDNPGDLRPRRVSPPWPGQDQIDNGPGGPFSCFVSAADGWAALALWCLDARYLRGLLTAQEMIAVFAPPIENDTASYAATVARKVGSGTLDLSSAATLEALCRAIAHYEESHDGAWSETQIKGGIRLGAAHWPRFRAERIAASVMIPPDHPGPADDLNAAELARIRHQDLT